MRWWAPIALLAATRVAIPLTVLAAGASGVPGLPVFHRDPRNGGLSGDATGFYAAAREFIAAWGRMPRAVLALSLLLLGAAGLAAVALRRRRPGLTAWIAAGVLLVVGCVVALGVHWMNPSGAAVFGWPLVWSIPLALLRVAGHLTPAAAWDVGVALSISFVALTVVAVAYLGRNASGRRSIGIAAAALWTFWPLCVGVIAGHDAWSNGQWEVEAGLHNYTEPLSTLLVTAAAAAVLAPRLTQLRLVLAGAAMSLATVVKLSNGLLAAAALAILFLRGRVREALPFLAGAIAFAPVVAVYWPLSYPKLFDNARSWPPDPFDPSHVVGAWTHSSLFDPSTLLIITPLAVVGSVAVRRPWPLALVAAFLVINPIFYSFYANTAEHPRFLYASLPELFVLTAAGVALLASFLPLAAPARRAT